MASYNKVTMMGNLTRDPEYKQLTSGQAVCKLGLASNRQFKNKQTGQLVQEVCFIDVDVWGQQAESCNQYLKKGRSILVEGRLKLDSWQDNDGQKRNKHSIVADRIIFLQGAQDDVEQSDESQEAASPEVTPATPLEPARKKIAKTVAPKVSGEIEFNDQKPFEDDLPF